MTILPALLALAAVPFWDSKPPRQWTDDELHDLLTNSPWAQQAISGKNDSGVQVYMATAAPVREAEAEAERRVERKKPVEDETAGEYREFLSANEGKYIVIAVQLNASSLLTPAEVKRMQEESVLRVGNRRHKMVGHFPPSPSDRWLRLVFPRVVTEADQKFRIELYVPGVNEPYRFAEFHTKDMKYKGRLEL